MNYRSMEVIEILSKDEIKILHEKILSGSLDDVENCVRTLNSQGIESCHALNTRNESALKVALLKCKFDIFAFLQSLNFKFGSHESFDELRAEVISKDPDAMSKIFRENLRFLEGSQVHKLVSITKVRPILNEQDKKEKYDKVGLWYEEMEKIPEISSLLKTISKADGVEIIIDFISIRDVDPSLGEKVFGTTYCNSGKIVIDGNRDDNDAMGTIVHEHGHLATNRVYGNSSKPYYFHDTESREKFEKVVKKFSDPKLYLQEKIIERVYVGSDGTPRPKDNLHKELIVRVPQILVQYKDQPDRISELRKIFSDLFEFWETKTSIDLANFNKNIEMMQATEYLNGILDVVSQIKNLELDCVGKSVILTGNNEKFTFTPSNVPLLTLKLIFNQLLSTQKSDTTRLNLFMDYKNLSNDNLLQDIESIAELRQKPKVFILSEDSKEPEINKSSYDFLNKLQKSNFDVTFVLHDSVDVSQVFGSFSHQIQEAQSLIWRDLKNFCQKKTLRKQINFQNRQIKYNEVLTPESKMLQDELLNVVLDTKSVFKNVVENKVETSSFQTSFYIPRTFKTQGDANSANGTRFDDQQILKHAEDKKIAILADVAGMGKTSTLLHFKKFLEEKHPSRFHFLIQLQKYSKYFISDDKFDEKASDDLNKIDKLIDILGISVDFDKKLFKELLNDSKVVLMFDGYDEVSPIYSKFVLHLVKFCQTTDKIQAWISTRTHLAMELEEALGARSFEILPFDAQEKINFFVKFWQNHTKETEDELKEKAQALVEKLSKTDNYKTFSDFIGVPLQIRMLAEIFTENYKDSMKSFLDHGNKINFYKFYDEFIKMKLAIRKQKGGVTTKDEILLEAQKVSIIEFHEQEALKQILEDEQVSKLSLRKIKGKLLTPEVVARLGILHKSSDDEDYQFVHQTFAEFFAARLLLDSSSVSMGEGYHSLNVSLESRFEPVEAIRKFISSFRTKFLKTISDNDDDEDEFFYEMSNEMQVFVYVLAEEKFKVVRTFLNSGLEMELHIDSLKSSLTSLSKTMFYDLMKNLMLEDQLNLVRLVFNAIDGDKQIFEKQFTLIDEGMFGTWFHISVWQIASVEVFELIWNEVFTKFDEKDRRKVLKAKDKCKNCILHLAVQSQNLQTFELILHIYKSTLNVKELETIFFDETDMCDNIIDHALDRNNEEIILELVFDFCIETLGKKKLKSLLVQLSWPSGIFPNCSFEILKCLIIKSEKFFTLDEMRFVFNYKFFENYCNSSEKFETFWYLFTFLYKKPQKQRQELMKCDEKGKTNAIEILFNANHLNTFKLIFDKFKEIVGENDMKKLMLLVDFEMSWLWEVEEKGAIRDFIFEFVKENFHENDMGNF